MVSRLLLLHTLESHALPVVGSIPLHGRLTSTAVLLLGLREAMPSEQLPQ
jgi:hypothetical protein